MGSFLYAKLPDLIFVFACGVAGQRVEVWLPVDGMCGWHLHRECGGVAGCTMHSFSS